MCSDLNMASGGDTSPRTLLTSRHPRRAEREGSEGAADRDGARCTRLAPAMQYADGRALLGGLLALVLGLIQCRRFFPGTHAV